MRRTTGRAGFALAPTRICALVMALLRDWGGAPRGRRRKAAELSTPKHHRTGSCAMHETTRRSSHGSLHIAVLVRCSACAPPAGGKRTLNGDQKKKGSRMRDPFDAISGVVPDLRAQLLTMMR